MKIWQVQQRQQPLNQQLQNKQLHSQKLRLLVKNLQLKNLQLQLRRIKARIKARVKAATRHPQGPRMKVRLSNSLKKSNIISLIRKIDLLAL